MKLEKYYIFFQFYSKNHLLELVFFHVKNTCENRADGVHLCFTIFEFYLTFGKELSKYFEGKNIIKEKFDKLGGNELLEKYLNFPDENLVLEIISIFQNF